jgi:hypothetical protein
MEHTQESSPADAIKKIFNPEGCLTQFMQSKSVTAMKSFNDGHFLDFYFHRMDDTLSNKNLARAPVILGFHHFTTIRTA